MKNIKTSFRLSGTLILGLIFFYFLIPQIKPLISSLSEVVVFRNLSLSYFWNEFAFYPILSLAFFLAFFWKVIFRQLAFPMWFGLLITASLTFFTEAVSFRSAIFFSSLIPIFFAIKGQFYFFLFFVTWDLIINFSLSYFYGALLGVIIGFTLVSAEFKWEFSEKIIAKFKNKFELRRQFFHAFISVLIVFLSYKQILNEAMLFGILIIGIFLILLCKKDKAPFLSNALRLFERRKHIKKFPGKGSFFLVLGSLLVLKFFPENIAYASILILGFGDSINNIVGRQWGRITHPFNQKKNLEGIWAGMFFSFLFSLIFVSPLQAALGTMVALTIESFEIKVFNFRVDDNLLIPISAALVMVLLP